MTSNSTRTEKDSMGEMRVPESALYGASTARAVENFPVSGIPFPASFIRALGIIKRACARANMELGDLDPKTAEAIVEAATEVIEGVHAHAHAIGDPRQTANVLATERRQIAIVFGLHAPV